MINTVVLGSNGILRPGKLLWLRALLWGVLFFMILLLPQVAIPIGASLMGGVPMMQFMHAPGPLLLGWTSFCALTAVALYAGLVLQVEKRPPSELALRPAITETAIGLGIGALMMSVTVAIMWAVGGVEISSQPVTDAWRALSLTVQSGIMEEIAFRLIVLRLLWRAFGLETALLISAFLFGIAHIFNPNSAWFPSIAIAIEAGIMLAAFYILTGRVWMSIGVHAGWNFTQGWIWGAPVSGTSDFAGGPLKLDPVPGVSDIVSGGGFGPEASIAGLLVGTIVGAIVLYMAWQRGRLHGLQTDPQIETFS